MTVDNLATVWNILDVACLVLVPFFWTKERYSRRAHRIVSNAKSFGKLLGNLF